MVRRPRQVPERAPLQPEKIATARYVGSPEHKAKKWWGGLPQGHVGPDGAARRPRRQHTTICPLTGAKDQARATQWLRSALSNGQFRYYEADKDFPKHVWYRDGEQLWFGFCVNSVLGEYKGCRSPRKSDVRFLINWLDISPNASPDERATVAELRINISGENVCMHLESGRSEDHVVLPLYSLAAGLAHSWWSIFGGRDRTYRLIDNRMGFAVPDVRMSFDGMFLDVWAKQRVLSNPPVRFWAGQSESLLRAEAERELEKLVGDVLDRLSKHGTDETSAALRWKRVQESRSNAQEAAFCEAAGALGLDPYELDDGAAALIESAANMFETDILNEFLAGATLRQTANAIEWIKNLEDRPSYQSLLPELRAIAESVQKEDVVGKAEQGWALGYRRAHLARSRVPRINARGSLRDLAQAFGGSSEYRLAPPVNGLMAVRSDHENGIHIYTRDHGRTPQAKEADYFAFARGVGDAICFPTPSRAVVNDVWYAHRQSAGRAFAAEFLAPIDEVEAMSDDGADIYSIADEFAVSTEVIERQLQNKDRIKAVRAVS